MRRDFFRVLVLMLAAGLLASGAGRSAFAGEKNHAAGIKLYKQSISTKEYEKRYNEVYGKFTQMMAEQGNPADFTLDDGRALFKKVEGSAGKSCASCHGKNGEKLKGIAASYPKYDPKINGVLTIAMQINRCLKDHMGAPELKYESHNELALDLYVKSLSNGVPIHVSISGPAKPFYLAGEAYYYKRQGQLNMSCAICHVKYAGHMIRANLLSNNRHHADHWPGYRLKWGKTGSIQKRFQGCNKKIRAKPLPLQCKTYRNLELYLTYQANGLPIEVPGFRM